VAWTNLWLPPSLPGPRQCTPRALASGAGDPPHVIKETPTASRHWSSRSHRATWCPGKGRPGPRAGAPERDHPRLGDDPGDRATWRRDPRRAQNDTDCGA